jgi:hypothetical protein
MLRQFIQLHASYHYSISVNKMIIDICDGDLNAGVLFSQILYWFGNDEHGNSRTRLIKNNEPCIAKEQNEWYEEVRLSKDQVKKSLKLLVQKGFIRVKNLMFNGFRTNHIWINENTIHDALDIYVNSKNVLVGVKNPTGRRKKPDRSVQKARPITMTNTKTKTEIKKDNVKDGDKSLRFIASLSREQKETFETMKRINSKEGIEFDDDTLCYFARRYSKQAIEYAYNYYFQEKAKVKSKAGFIRRSIEKGWKSTTPLENANKKYAEEFKTNFKFRQMIILKKYVKIDGTPKEFYYHMPTVEFERSIKEMYEWIGKT